MKYPLLTENPSAFCQSQHIDDEKFFPDERTISALFFSAPYPGNQKFSGHPTGLLYALTVLADRKSRVYGPSSTLDEISVWCPDGVLKVCDSPFEKALREKLQQRQPKFIGISTFSVSYLNGIAAMKLIKEELPETVVIFGGAHEDNFVEYYNRLGHIDADFVIAGDGMFILDELYKLVEENANATVDEIKELVTCYQNRFTNLPGAGLLLYNYCDRLQKIYTSNGAFNQPGLPIALDSIPVMPRYLLLDEEFLSRRFSAFPNQKTAQMMLGQGCPYNCPFCSEAIQRVWYETNAPRANNAIRNLFHVEKELHELRTSGYSAIFFDDSTLLAKPQSYLQSLIQLLGQFSFQWGGQTTQTSIHVNAKLLPQMVEVGLRYLYVGIEHFEETMIDLFGKKAGAGDKFGRWSFRDTLSLLQSQGIKTAISLTFGHPDPQNPRHTTKETAQTARYTIERATELAFEFEETVMGVSMNLVTYHPGTVITQQYEQKGLGELDFIGHPNRRQPFTYFEEGIGPHAPGMTDELVSEIWHYGQGKLGDKLFL